MHKVSVIVTCYNHEKYIEQCLRSIFQQSVQKIELLVINDGSTDQSDEIITKTIQCSPFEKTEYIFQNNQGSCISRNIGLDWSTGDFILLVDSDNFLPVDYVEKMLDLLVKTNRDVAYASLKDAETKEILNEVPDFSLGRFIHANFIDTCSLIRKSILGDCRFDTKLNRLFMQDYDFFLHLVYNGAKPIKVAGLYQNYRVLADSIGNRGEHRLSRVQWFETYLYIVGKYPEYSSTVTSNVAHWYGSLNSDFEIVDEERDNLSRKAQFLAERLEENERVILSKNKEIASIEKLLQEKDTYIDKLIVQYLDVVNSRSWYTGRMITFPIRKIKNIFLKAFSKDSSIQSTDSGGNNQMETSGRDENSPKPELIDFSYNPLISIVMPVYNVEKMWLETCINSIRNQWYDNWEICLSDDASTNEELLSYLNELQENDEKIHVVFRKENGHISAATNSALEIAKGDFIALIDNDDELTVDALYEVVKALNTNQSLNVIYSDEDKIKEDGQCYDAHFKPDWSPDLILNQNYVSHLGVYRTSIAREIGGFRIGYEGSQDHDFLLRFTEKIANDTIYHIPKILYHWRALEGSTAFDQESKSYAFESGIRAVRDALSRRGISGHVTRGKYLGIYEIEYDIIDEPLVSIIIPTRNAYDDVKGCINSIIVKSTYKNYEIIMVDNGSDDPNMAGLYRQYKDLLRERFKLLDLDIPFNYSRINNLAVKEASGEYLLFLNNDTSVISPNWIETMLGFAQFDRVGCVGAKLLYFDDTIQHAGVILGSYGVAGHTFLNVDKKDSGYFGRLHVDYNYTVVTAACLMVSKKDFNLVEGFDETLEVAFNDVDLCIRIYQLGRNNVWAHNAELYHYESKSRGKEDTEEKKKRFAGEINKMTQKHGEILYSDPAYNINFSLQEAPFTAVGR